jgi:Domain of unknown function (DUF4345)
MSLTETLTRNDGAATAFWRLAPWLVRVTLALPATLFLFIASKYLSDPVGVAAGSGMSLGSPAAVTDVRVSGAVFLAVAVTILVSLMGTRRLRAGLVLTTTLVGIVTATRVLGIAIDGPASESVFKLGAELVLLTISLAGLAIESARRRHTERTAA